VDCASLPENLLESELFGHSKGAFTGAASDKIGLFQFAHKGSLFLDEIGEIPQGVQAKLLRALQHKEVRPVGASSTIPVDIRVISATHRNLAEMVSEGRFRSDLFYRLNVVRIEIPPLRERAEDIPMLVHHFLAKYRRERGPIEEIEAGALEALSEAAWPGNVRELENAVEAALALAPGPRLRAADLPFVRRGSRTSQHALPANLPLDLDAYERAAVERAIAECGGDVSAAARALGIGRSTLYRKLDRHGLKPPRASAGAASVHVLATPSKLG
jgi:transcriptional regulator with PAS, ATPase and Fis domain